MYFLLGPLLNSGATKNSKKHSLSTKTRTGLLGSNLTSSKSDITKTTEYESLAV